MRFAQPSQSWALLLGTASYSAQGLSPLPAVANNLADLRDVLVDPGLGGLDGKRCIARAGLSGQGPMGVELATVAKQAEDTLIVYYAGHGVVDRSGELFLALPDTDPDHVEYTAMPIALVRRAIADSPARNRILILDCCYSGRAIEAMASPSALISGQIEIAGAYTLTSSPKNRTSQAPTGARNTAFTGELLSLLRAGIDNASEGLSLDEIYQELRRARLSRGQDEPQRCSTATIGHLALVRNASFSVGRPADPQGPAPVVAASPPAQRPAPAPAGVMPRPVAKRVVARAAVAAPPWAAGVAAWRAGRLDEANRLIKSAAEAASDARTSSALYIVLAMIYLHEYPDPNSAEQLLADAGDCGDVRLAQLGRLYRGYALELRGRNDAAADQYRQVMGTSEADCAAFAAARLGWLLTDQGRTEEAERVFLAGHALADSPASAWSTLGLADALKRSRRSGEAAARYEEALASGDALATAHAAVGLRRFFMEGGLTAEAAEMARCVSENPAASPLWPTVLRDEAPKTPDGRIYAMHKWLTWVRSAHGESACFASKEKRGQQFILFENRDGLTMSVCVTPRALPRGLRRQYSEHISFQLAEIGLKADVASVEGGDTWVRNVADKTDQELAELSENVLVESLTGRPDFALSVESEPDTTAAPEPRAPAPELLPW
jgi:tetratricopeptide (TPR) repeat protein